MHVLKKEYPFPPFSSCQSRRGCIVDMHNATPPDVACCGFSSHPTTPDCCTSCCCWVSVSSLLKFLRNRKEQNKTQAQFVLLLRVTFWVRRSPRRLAWPATTRPCLNRLVIISASLRVSPPLCFTATPLYFLSLCPLLLFAVHQTIHSLQFISFFFITILFSIVISLLPVRPSVRPVSDLLIDFSTSQPAR